MMAYSTAEAPASGVRCRRGLLNISRTPSGAVSLPSRWMRGIPDVVLPGRSLERSGIHGEGRET
jgi:hypothetical protein